MTVGFTVGKFYPPHKGHRLLIDTARRQVDRMIVMLAHHPSQKIPGELRRDWLREIHPDCEIHLVPDELSDDSREWADFIVKYLGRAPDVVFSSEEYGPRYAAIMGSKHVMVDLARGVVPVSGTKIRSAPLAHLDFMEPCVRVHFVRRVVLLGAESTGKTTLAQKLATHFKTDWVPEYGREHWERKVAGLTMADPLPGWTPDEFVHIATEQQRRENDAARRANRVLICDTNAFTTGTWFERYQNARDHRVDAIGSRDKADLYLLASPEVPFVQDGFRDGEKIRDWMHGRLEEQLSKLSVPHATLSGSFAERDRRAIDKVTELLSLPFAL